MTDLKTLHDGYVDRLKIAHNNGEIAENENYTEDIRLFLNFLEEGGLSPGEGLLKYCDYLDKQLHDPTSKINKPSTCRVKLAAAKKVLRYIIKHIKGLPNVTFEDVYKIESEIEALKSTRFGDKEGLSEDDILSREEVGKVIGGTTDTTVRLIMEFLANTGVRISEAITIPLSQIKANGKVKISILGKGNKTRTVMIPKDLYERIQAHFGGKTYLFEHNGKPYNRNSMTQRIKYATLKTIGREVSAHGFRHYFATYLLNEQKYDLKRVSIMLGHSSVKITADIYQSVILGDKDWEGGFLEL